MLKKIQVIFTMFTMAKIILESKCTVFIYQWTINVTRIFLFALRVVQIALDLYLLLETCKLR